MKRLNRLSTTCATLLTLGVLAAAAPAARADHVYPPGWNKPDLNVPKALYNFSPGCQGDTNRYWPGKKSCYDNDGPVSRPIPYGPVIYGMVPGGGRTYHRLH
jgi:hypothetical protein